MIITILSAAVVSTAILVAISFVKRLCRGALAKSRAA